MYDDLTMPWDVPQPVLAYPRSSHTRLEWNRNGKLEDGEVDFFSTSDDTSLRELSDSLGTASMVTEWRKANPDLVGTERDCVDMTIVRIAKAIRETDNEGGDWRELRLKTGCATTLLLFRRQA
jgi:hypothetical protein